MSWCMHIHNWVLLYSFMVSAICIILRQLRSEQFCVAKVAWDCIFIAASHKSSPNPAVSFFRGPWISVFTFLSLPSYSLAPWVNWFFLVSIYSSLLLRNLALIWQLLHSAFLLAKLFAYLFFPLDCKLLAIELRTFSFQCSPSIGIWVINLMNANEQNINFMSLKKRGGFWFKTCIKDLEQNETFSLKSLTSCNSSDIHWVQCYSLFELGRLACCV